MATPYKKKPNNFDKLLESSKPQPQTQPQSTLTNPTQPTKPQKTPTPDGFMYDEKTGMPTGITRNGKTYFGLNLDEAENIQNQETRIQAIKGGTTIPSSTQKMQERAVQEQQIVTQQEQRRVLGEERPQVDLTPVSTGSQLGDTLGGFGAIGLAIRGAMKDGTFGKTLQKFALNNDPSEITPQVMRTEALQEIENQTIKEGLSLRQRLGVLFEGLLPIRIAGFNMSSVGKIAGAVSPTEDIDSLKNQMKKVQEQAVLNEKRVKEGILDPQTANREMQEFEKELTEYQSKIRFLINYSGYYRSNPEAINELENEILQTQELFLNSKLNLIPLKMASDEEILWELKKQEYE